MPSFKINVEALFQRLYHLTGSQPLDVNVGPAAFLQTLHKSALTNSGNWQEHLDVYMRCLSDRGAINAEQETELLALAGKCPVPGPTYWTLLSPILWLMLGALSVLGWLTFSLSSMLLLLFGLAAVLGGGYFGWILCPRPERQPRRRSHLLQPLFNAGFLAAIAAGVAIFIPELAKELYFPYVKSLHADEVKRFSDASDGMPAVRKMAKEQFGVDLVLNFPDNNWAATALAIPGLSSPASVDPEPGYCVLNIDRNSLNDDFGVKDAKMRSPWLMGVLAHEISHCADMTRDLSTLDGRSVVATHALAPSLAGGANDIHSYILAANQPATKLWREAFADIGAIGYWKITVPAGADKLAGALREKRSTAKEDKIHMTTCWIDHARKAPAPASLDQLPKWADKIRSSARCGGV